MKSQLDDVAAFFSKVTLPTDPIRLNDHTVIESPREFVNGHIQYVTENLGKRVAEPYLERLIKLQQIIERK